MKRSRNFEPTAGYSKTRIRKKFFKCELYDVTRNPEEWITKILRGVLQKLDVKIDDSEMMTYILSKTTG